MTDDASDYNTGIIKEFRANQGRVGGIWADTLARELEGTDRAGLWPELVAVYPQLAEAQDKTGRQFPLFVLTRSEGGSHG